MADNAVRDQANSKGGAGQFQTEKPTTHHHPENDALTMRGSACISQSWGVSVITLLTISQSPRCKPK